ncbi:cyclic nucleotide-binding domain protein [Bacteriovorax sp. Seq25_V]|nr:cyclic nucleotide-binding domain protein [Bacteriovorax sp. Seq25_V]
MTFDIEDNTLHQLRERGEHITYTATSNLFYEGQIPVVAYLVISGNIHLTKNKKIKKTIGSGCLLGVKELLNNQPVNYSAVIMPGSDICFLSRSDFNEIIENEDDLSDKISQLLAI